jgi:hypothetical protein
MDERRIPDGEESFKNMLASGGTIFPHLFLMKENRRLDDFGFDFSHSFVVVVWTREVGRHC